MPEHLMLRLEGPLQAWGDVALDPRRPTRRFPSRSALAGLLANALGWEYRDAERITQLQDALRYAVREDRRAHLLRDYQTADLGRETQGWTRWGIERRGGGSATGTQILEKFYLADGSFLVAVALHEGAPASLAEIADALLRPARPLFLGRKGCPPALPIFEGIQEAASPFLALRWRYPEAVTGSLRCWYEAGDGPEEYHDVGSVEIWDRRDFVTNRFTGSRRIIEGRIGPPSPVRSA